MQALEAMIEGMLSSTDHPELRIRRNRDGRVSVRVYARNATKTSKGFVSAKWSDCTATPIRATFDRRRPSKSSSRPSRRNPY